MAILRVRDENGNTFDIPALKGDPGITPQVNIIEGKEPDGRNNLTVEVKYTIDGIVSKQSAVVVDGKDAPQESVLFIPQSLTEAQKAQVRANIGATAGEEVEFADSVEWLNENGDTAKKYVLPDGFIYAYMEKYVTEKHNANTGIINLRPAVNTSMHSTLESEPGVLCSDLIPFDPYWQTMPSDERPKSTINISGIAKLVPAYTSALGIYYYKADGTFLTYMKGSQLASLPYSSDTAELTLPTSFMLKDSAFSAGGWTNVGYVRLQLGISTSGNITDEDVANISINVPYYDYEGTRTGWFSTGQQHSNDKATQQNSADIASLKERTDAVEAAVADIRDAIESGGLTGVKTGEVLYAVGDSITKGYGLSDLNSWPKRMIGINGYDSEKSVVLGYSGSGFCTTGESKTARIVVDETDFSEADVVTVAWGVNDWKNYNATLEDFFSEMEYCFTKIRGDNPYCRIFYILPFNWKPASSSFDTFYALGYAGDSNNARPYGNTLQTFVNMIKDRFAEEPLKDLDIHVVDMTKTPAITRYNINTALLDGLHPTSDCHGLLAKEIAKILAQA